MAATISPETKHKDFQTDIKDCLKFVVENTGTTMLEISFDKGNTWIKVKPEALREFEVTGELFEGEMAGRFGDVYTYPGETPQPARNEVLVIKTMFKCPNRK